MEEKIIFKHSVDGKVGVSLPPLQSESSVVASIPETLRRKTSLGLPEVSEPEVVRHFTRLSQQNFSVDTHFYPLGSCTMKYNPKINEDLAALAGFADLHPYEGNDYSQGLLQLLYELDRDLSALTGMARFSLQPAAGAHGELLGMMLVQAYHAKRGDTKRRKVIVPDSSHGTNPASANVYGFDIVEVKSNSDGCVDLDALRAAVDDECACLMLTNPNTLGLFEKDILTIAKIVHEAGGLLYYDGANMNAMMGLCRPGDMGFDIVHLNLHKTFSTPHGGGGPGAGPVGVKEYLVEYLPVPMIEKQGDRFVLYDDMPDSVGKVKTFYGNISVLIKAYCYIRTLGIEGLSRATEDAIINANYMKARLEQKCTVPYRDYCMHEFVVSAVEYGAAGIHAVDVGKRLLDYGFHAPTVAFPLIVPDALMIEPTETESKETLDEFIEAFIAIIGEIGTNAEVVKQAPHTMHRKRGDEVAAARFPDLAYSPV